ncbi:asparagine synthase-related protein [Georgenia sp. H159]|uniref:asparagine synthase-related protein n=1 Tax=Georgenia sp. H159 TaxID=3076115 RepID=UPI002D7A32E0|nr:asparagine synthase-related protein [Georgenia sp. H159]
MSTPTVHATFERLSREELLLATPRSDGAGVADVAGPATGLTAREAIEEVLLEALAAPPCYVLFSGGRDSSALLALAVTLARQHALPLPVPVTVRHPHAPEADETWWQELVLEHLGLRHGVVLEFQHEQRLLSDAATGALRRHGPVWPEAVQLHGAIYRDLDPGTIVTGEGGDMLLSGRRTGALRDALALRRPRRRHLRRGLQAAQPGVARRRAARTHAGSGAPSWLRPPAVAAYVHDAVSASVEPLRWDAATRALMYSRPMTVFIANVEAAIAEYGSRPVTPFADGRVVEALAREAGPLGWGNRTALFRRLFPDVLPDRVLSRTSKAWFNSTRWGPEEREFARLWDGFGIDPEWVDPDELRAAWLVADPHPGADFLLHLAWAHTHGIPAEPEAWS